MSTWLLLAVTLLWMTAVAMMIVKTPHTMAVMYRIQAVAEAGVASLLAIFGHRPAFWSVAALIIVLKIFVIPGVMNRWLKSMRRAYGTHGPAGMSALLMLALLLSAGGIVVGRLGLPYPLPMGLVLAAMLVTFVQLSGRYEVWSLLWGILSLETVMDVGALTWGTSIPAIGEVGIDVTGLALALVLAYVAAEVRRVKHSLDVRDLEELIG
ncbi:hypothetical protein [Sulfobacillus harzensis]|uniref:Hydrogenase n=1 Tax=Sulfobacillus harzensis TaxID=2729629 RepID=A0A7Y0L2M4_9FIRM|nr:hypothetical protein [Sulfobacillus harzensis]NMP21943.1 hypothetical protein [Sulfobacillus harzensis]